MELPVSPDQPLQGNNGLHLSGYILADVKLLLNPRESAAGNLQKQAALQHTCKQQFNILASSLHDIFLDPSDQILRDLMAKRDQAHQRVLQIRSTRSAVQAYKDACRILQKLLNVPGDIEPEVLENIQKGSVNTALDEKPTMDEMVRASKEKMEKHQVETEFQQKYGNTGELTCPTDCTDGSSKYGRKAMYHKPGRMPT